MSARSVLAAALIALAAAASATDVFPGRGGESGLLDVPTADVVAPGSGTLASELSLSRVRGTPGMTLSPFPLSVVTGVARGLEAGAALRQWGRPGDPSPTPTLFAAALKLQLLDAAALRPALAVDVYIDRANEKRTGGGRAIATTPQLGPARLSAFAGAEGFAAGGGLSVTAGVAASLAMTSHLDLVGDGVITRDGPLAGAALRWQLTQNVGLTVGGDWIARDGGLRVGMGFAVAARPARRQAAAPAAKVTPVVEAAPRPAAGPQFLDDRPHFRLRLDGIAADQPKRTHLVASAAPGSRGAPRAEAEEIGKPERLGISLRTEARERQRRIVAEALAAREERLEPSRERLAAREREVAARGAALDARELSLGTPGMPTHRELQLAEAEEQARATERDLARQEHESQGAIDAAAARERAAREREAQASDAAGHDPAARAASQKRVEERIAATRQRIEATEVAQGLASSRIDAAERRLSLRVDRLALLERRATATSAAAQAAPGGTSAEAPRDAREVVLSHRADVERCVEAELARRRIVRADGVLRVRVDPTGRVAAVTYEPDQGALFTDECLAEAARAWALPATASAYAVDVSITVVATGGAR